MAIYHLSMKPISRASGRSAVAAAAYRAGQKLTNDRDGLTHDFTRKGGIAHAEIVLPAGADADWALDRSRLWNAAEAAEKRKDARVAREIEVALPCELSDSQRLALTRAFAQDVANRYGVAVDFSIHRPDGDTDVRNHHAHIMLTTRKVGRSGLGEKSDLELENKKLVALGRPTSHEQLRRLREDWELTANRHLALAGHDVRIDHRSHLDAGLEIQPTQHMGVHASQMERRGKSVVRTRLDRDAARENARLIRARPEQAVTVITKEKSVFDRQDVARTLHRYIDKPEEFQAAFARVMASPALVELQPERRDAAGRTIEDARYSTQEMVAVEREMAESADHLAGGSGYAVSRSAVERALKHRSFLSEEQRAAILHITGPERISAVVGLAGAGKSTMLSAAREAWEGAGYRVHGAALAGKAAEGLEESSGIASRTLASWERGWDRGFAQIGPKDVFVIDETGMVGSRQLGRFITEADRAGAKIVLVGDPEQLQPIGPGAAFRAVTERVGFAELGEIRRQEEGWQREASLNFARHNIDAGLVAYAEKNAVRFADASTLFNEIVRDVMADRDARPDGTRLVLAHRRVDVADLNDAIRAARQARGELQNECVYRTTEGERAFAPGDRVLFRENNRELGVKNGMLGTVERAGPDRLEIRLDAVRGAGRVVSVSMVDYAEVDHGYATTIHKAQGATVDRTYVLASRSMDRHLTYVSMTRHRQSATLYAARDEFADLDALSARLSRSRAKETTLDYAERRGIDIRSEIVVQTPESRRGMFDDLTLRTGRPPIAIDRDMALGKGGPPSTQDLERAAGLRHEKLVQLNPELRAQRLVKEWKGLEAQHQRLAGRDAKTRTGIAARLKSIAGAIKRDPQLESLMRSHAKELGIDMESRLGRVLRARGIGQAMDHIVRGRDRGLER